MRHIETRLLWFAFGFLTGAVAYAAIDDRKKDPASYQTTA